MGILYRISHRIDRLVGSLQILVDMNATRLPDLQSGLLRETRLRTDTDGQQHHLGVKGNSGPEPDQNIVSLPLKRLHSLFQVQPYPLL